MWVSWSAINTKCRADSDLVWQDAKGVDWRARIKNIRYQSRHLTITFEWIASNEGGSWQGRRRNIEPLETPMSPTGLFEEDGRLAFHTISPVGRGRQTKQTNYTIVLGEANDFDSSVVAGI